MKRLLLLITLTALLVPWAVQADELTINDGTTTNSYVPIYGLYTDTQGTNSEFIIPAETDGMSDLVGATINTLTFYISNPPVSWGTPVIQLYIGEVDETTISALHGPSNFTIVATGVWDNTQSTLEIVFDNPYTYEGGNLLIGAYVQTAGDYKTTNFLGVTAPSGAARYNQGSGAGSAQSFLPKVTFDYTPGSGSTCDKPSSFEVSNIAATGATLTWADGSGSYNVEYKKASDSDWTSLLASTSDLTADLTELMPNTPYQARVQSVCGSDVSGWKSASFTTACGVITSFPWNENFERYSSGDFADPCWVNEHIAGTAAYVFKIYTSSNGGNSTHQLQLPDEATGNMIKLVLPEMNLPGNNYQFVLDVYRNNSTYNNNYPYEGIRVFVSTDGEIEGATELAFIPRQYSVGNDTIPAESAAGWYTYALPLGISGNCYIILRGESQYCTSTYMDNFLVEQIPTCKKPSALMLETPSSRTAHAASLKWTKGEESQIAWEIAYSKLANFNPDEQITDSIASADSNPFTLSGLEQSTTYYAYVRANCGIEDGKSAWSSNKASFSTLSGHQALSNLALVDGSLESQSAEVNWKPNAYNELHASYEIYYSKLSTLPATEEALSIDSLIQNISDTFYVFSDLDPETQYYVWVRDNCATDGLSAWSSRASFTTLANCAVPFNLAASEVSAHEATIAWEGNNDSYSVQYRTAAYAEGIEEAFGTSIPSGWSMYTGLLDDDGTATLSEATYGWSFGANNGVFDNHARVNIYGNNQRWLVMPIMAIEDGFIISFDLALTAYSGTLVSPQTSGTDDKFIVLISTDNKAKWTTLRQWDNADSKDVYNNIACSATGEHISIDLSAYSGQNAYIAFYGESTVSNADNNLHIDNVLVGINHDAGQWQSVSSNVKSKQISGLAPETKYDVQVLGICGAITTNPSEIISFTTTPSCLPVSNLAVSDITASGASFSWVDNSTQTQWQYACVDAGVTPENWTLVINVASVNVSGLTANTPYDFYVRAYCGVDDHSEAIKLNFRTECEAIAITFDTPYEENFEDPIVTTTYSQAGQMPDCWEGSPAAYNGPKILSEDDYYNYAASGQVLYFYGSGNNYAVLPKFSNPLSDLQISFKWATESSSYGTLTLGYITDEDVDYNTFKAIKAFLASSASYHQLVQENIFLDTLPASASKLVFRWYYSGQYGCNVDDIVIRLANIVDINASEYATYFNSEKAYIMPAGVTGHAFANGVLSDVIYQSADVVPAAIPLVLHGPAGSYLLASSSEAGAPLSVANDLIGVNVETEIEDESGYLFYVLSLNAANDVDSVGFYWMNSTGAGGFTMPAHKAYLKLLKPTDPTSAPAAFFLFNGENGATWLENLEGVEGTVKFMHEGNIYILRDSIIYDATGRKVRELK